MTETSVHKVNSASSPKGTMGQKYLACGVSMAMRLWENVEPGNDHPPSVRDYETVGYVIRGRAELKLGNQSLLLEPGDSWIVPRGAQGDGINFSIAALKHLPKRTRKALGKQAAKARNSQR